MKKSLKVLAAGLLFAAIAAAQATIGAITNNYSYVPPGLPNYGIAQGSIFSIFGTFPNVATSTLQGVPLTTKVNNVSVNVTVNGTTTAAIIYYVSQNLIDAILPSGTPAGTGTLTVVLPNTNTVSTPITVVAGAFGILTLNQGGTGAAWAFDANNNYATIGYATAANPGDVIVVYGSGLGPVTGDETQTQTQTNLSSPIEVDVGGISASVAYHGRTVFPGLDQVNFTVPSNVAPGCNVSLVVKTGNFVSNATTIAVAAAGGRVCSDANFGYSATVLSKCATSGCSTGSINVSKTTSTTQGITVPGVGTIGGGTTTSDSISASFSKISAAQAATGIYSPLTASIGSCTVYTFSFSGNNLPNLPTVNFTPLNAGTITASGAASTSMTYNSQFGSYSASDPNGKLISSAGGAINFTNGGGGPDVGALNGATVNLGTQLTSTGSTGVSGISTVTRSSGQTVTWSGGNPGTFVVISGYSAATVGNSTSNFVAAYFWCTAPVAAGSFNIPSTVLLALPPTGTITQQGVSIAFPTILSISNSTNPASFTATGIDQGIASGSYGISNQVTYK